MKRYTSDILWSVLHGEPISDDNYWINQGKIPLGTIRPYEMYELNKDGTRNIPKEDIVSIPFDPISKKSDERSAYNYLFLGASGDGKSLMIKTIWHVLHYAGFYTCYFDPTKTASGRAKRGWDSPRIPPNIEPKGIPLQHFMPCWSTEKIKHLVPGNFRTYSTRLHKINKRIQWTSLDMSIHGSSFITKQINRLGCNATVQKLKDIAFDCEVTELAKETYNNISRVLTQIDDIGLIDTDNHELELIREWLKGYSVVISYNNADRLLMAFDIAQKIMDGAEYYYTNPITNEPNRNPIMYIFDDAKDYAKDIKVGSKTIPSLAVNEIIDIGVNYRGRGILNTLAIQSLNILDETIAETYKIKIISPLFQSVNQLSKINIPRKAIDVLKSNELVVDRRYHLMQWVLVDENNDVIEFFPFTPPCNHFTEVYFDKSNRGKSYVQT